MTGFDAVTRRIGRRFARPVIALPAADGGGAGVADSASVAHREVAHGRPGAVVTAGASAKVSAGLPASGQAPTSLICVSDLDIEGLGSHLDLEQAAALVRELDARAAEPMAARVRAMVLTRMIAHLQGQQAEAVAQAVETLERDDMQRVTRGPIVHQPDRRAAARRNAVAMVASDLVVSARQVHTVIRLAGQYAREPQLRAATWQGVLDQAKSLVVVDAVARVPEGLRTRAIVGGLVYAALDRPLRAAKAEVSRMVAPFLARATVPDRGERLEREAGVWAEDLGGGVAKLTVVDATEAIAAMLTVADAGVLSLRHRGVTGATGRLKAGVLAHLARWALRSQQIATAFGTLAPLDGDHGRPVRIGLVECAPAMLFGSDAAPRVWAIEGVGAMSNELVEAMMDDPSWDGLVRQISLVDLDDPSYQRVRRHRSSHHDPTPTQIEWIERRDQNLCPRPGCCDLSPPSEIHHTERFAETGVSELDGLIKVHPSCHRILHSGWKARFDGATWHFHDPHGIRHARPARGLRPVGRGDPSLGVAPPGVAPPGVGRLGVAPPGVGRLGVAPPGVGRSGVAPPGVGRSGVGRSGVGRPGVGRPGGGRSSAVPNG